METKRDVLADVTFGGRVAEDELQYLQYYFVETQQYLELINGRIDIIYGPKGSGKSALYGLLFPDRTRSTMSSTLRGNDRVSCIGIVDPNENPVFDEIRLDPQASEKDFRHLWKLYFLVIFAAYVRDFDSSDQQLRSQAHNVIEILVANNLLPVKRERGLKAYWSATVRYIKQYNPTIGLEVKCDSVTGTPSLLGKLSLNEPSPEQTSLGQVSIESALNILTEFIKQQGLKLWVGIDRLDAAFSDDRQMETKIIRALFRVYLDLKIYIDFKVKIFLRDDIWKQITEAGDGFREASNIARCTTITWDRNSLLNLIIKRALDSQSVLDYYKVVRREEILDDIHKQESLFRQIFPREMLYGKRYIHTLDWMLKMIQDASERPCPRELLHLIQAARANQIRAYEHGMISPEEPDLIGGQSLRNALIEVSEFRYTNTFCAEHPRLVVHVKKLWGKKTTQTLESLSKNFDKSNAETLQIAEELVDAGFFSQRVTKGRLHYIIPHLYRQALRLPNK